MNNYQLIELENLVKKLERRIFDLEQTKTVLVPYPVYQQPIVQQRYFPQISGPTCGFYPPVTNLVPANYNN